MPQVLPQGTVNCLLVQAAVIVSLILLGRYFEAKAKGRNFASDTHHLVGMQPKTARIQRDGQVVEVAVAEVVRNYCTVRVSVCQSMVRWLKGTAILMNL